MELLVTVLRRSGSGKDERGYFLLTISSNHDAAVSFEQEAHTVVSTGAAGFITADHQVGIAVFNAIHILAFCRSHLPDHLHIIGSERFGNGIATGSLSVKEVLAALLSVIEETVGHVADEEVTITERDAGISQSLKGFLQLGTENINFLISH